MESKIVTVRAERNMISQQYERVKCLGAGSVGMVYIARDAENHKRLVALKILFKEIAENQEWIEQFQNQISAFSAINHPNCIKAYEYFQDDGAAGHIMEYVNGGNLSFYLDSNPEITIEEALYLLRQIIFGITAFHDAGLIHGNLKPENILLTRELKPKLSEIIFNSSSFRTSLWERRGIYGTVDHIAPEFLAFGQVDERTDIYAAGVLGYQMITGRPPFGGSGVMAAVAKRLAEKPPSPRRVTKDCPRFVSDFVMTALASNPDHRYGTAREMSAALDAVLKRLSFH